VPRPGHPDALGEAVPFARPDREEGAVRAGLTGCPPDVGCDRTASPGSCISGFPFGDQGPKACRPPTASRPCLSVPRPVYSRAVLSLPLLR